MNIWEYIKTIEGKEEEEKKEQLKAVSGGGGAVGVIEKEEEPEDPLVLLNESIEDKYKEFTKLQKTLSAFTLEGIPQAIQPSIVANYNKQIDRFNSLIGELQINIAERDQIQSTLKKQDFVKRKQFGIYQPQPEVKPQPQESGLKDIWDAFRLGASGMFHRSKQYFSSALPNMIFRDLTVNDTVSQYAGMTESQVEKLNIENRKKRESYKEGYIRGESNYNLWLQKNPELQPREEWEKGVIETIRENPKILTKPAYWGYVAAESAAFTLGVMGTVLATTAVTGNPLIGLASGVLIATPMQTQELYEDLIDNGATKEQATKLAMPIGGIIAAVEVMGDLPILASVSAPFKKLLFGNIRKGVVKSATGFLKRGIKRAVLIEFSETLEEVVQGAIQDATVKTVNENRDMLENIPETVVHTLIATAPFALVGLGSEVQINKQLQEKITNVNFLNAVRVQLEEQGFIPRMEAEVYAAEPEKLTPKELEAKREMLRGRGVKEELLTDEFVKIARVTEIPKVKEEKVEEEMTPEELEELRVLREARVVPEEEITKEKVLEKVKPEAKYQLPAITGIRTEHPIHFYVKSDVINKFKDAKTFKRNIEKARKVVISDKELDDLSNYNIEEEFGSLENYYNWAKQNKAKIKGVKEQYDKFIDKLPVDEKTKAIWKEDPENFELNYGDYLRRVKPEVKVEPKIEPKKEDFEALKTTDKNKELFYEKYNNVYIETKGSYDKLLEEQVKNLKEEGFKGVEKGGLKRDEEGKVIGRYPTVSKNPKWYRDFYARENKKPSDADLREIARDQLLRGHIEDYGEVSANETFIKIEAQLDNYEAILSDIKDGDYSFETPKNVEKLNEKLKEMKKENKKIVKDLKTELATLKAEREAKYVGLKEEVEAGKKVEVEIGIKKGLKVAKAELKGRAIKGMPKAEIKEGNKLIQQIQMMVKDRGFTKKQFSDIKMTHGGARHLTGKTKRMTIPQLKAVLKAVEKARPRQIGHEKVVTLKTEKKIQSLKDNLIDKLQMSEEAYQKVLKDVGIYKEPKYVDAKHFITEEKGKKLIYRLIDESNILRITEPLRIALEKFPEAKKIADELDKRIRLEGKERLKDPHELNSMRKYIQVMEGMTGAKLFSIYQDLIDSHLENRADLNNLIMEFDEYRDVIKDEEALKRVEIWILNKSTLKGVPKVSKKITEEEIALAKKIQGVLKDYEVRARTEKFLDNIENLKGMPQYIEYRKEINKAKDIYESKGYDELVDYMKTQEWGVIKSGYDPLQVVSAQVRLYKAKSTTLGKTHIEVRKDIEYKEQDKNVIQRLFSYKRQMDNLSVMRLKIRAFVTLTEENLDKFKDPNRVKTNIEVFFRELKGYDRPENWFDRGLNRLYAQAMTTIIMGSPALSFRNLGQNIGLGHDKMMLIDPRNKNLTPEEMDYLETYVQQAEFMRIDWFMTGEKPLPGLKFLTDIIKKVNLYPRSDIANRRWGYWAKINQVRMAFDKNVSLAKKMEEAKFSDMTLLEQKRALEILSKDGQKAMEKYVARVYVDDVHFIYERAQRAPAEMGRMGRIMGNLMLFPRAYWEKLAQHSKKMTDKRAPFREQVRAFKVIASVLIGGALVSVAYKKITGRRKSPYDPFELLAYTPGGLAIQTIGAVSDVFTNIVLASKGDEKAMADLTTAIPNALDMFVPFYNYALRGIEATTDTKNIDRLALRKLRMLIDKEYQVRGGAYKLERNAMEKWQYFLSGAGIDVAIKEREKEEREKLKAKPKIEEPKGFGGKGLISVGAEPKGFGD